MSHSPDSFLAAFSEFPPPEPGEYALDPILEYLGISLNDLEVFGLFGFHDSLSTNIHKHSLSVVGSVVLRRGRGVDRYVVLPNMLTFLQMVLAKGAGHNFTLHPLPEAVLAAASNS